MEKDYFYSEERDRELEELIKEISTIPDDEGRISFFKNLPAKDYYELLSFMRYETEKMRYENQKEREKKEALLQRREALLKERESLKKEVEAKFEAANTLLEIFGEKAYPFKFGDA